MARYSATFSVSSGPANCSFQKTSRYNFAPQHYSCIVCTASLAHTCTNIITQGSDMLINRPWRAATHDFLQFTLKVWTVSVWFMLTTQEFQQPNTFTGVHSSSSSPTVIRKLCSGLKKKHRSDLTACSGSWGKMLNWLSEAQSRGVCTKSP